MSEKECIRLFADGALIKECKQKLASAATSFSRLSQILSLAGNEVRMKILYLLEEENELCPCDISDILDMTVPAISQHLRKLKDANIIQPRRNGQTIFYSLKEEHLEIVKPLFQHISLVTKKKQRI